MNLEFHPVTMHALLSGLKLKIRVWETWHGNGVLIAYVLCSYASLNQPTYANFIPSGDVCVYLKTVHLLNWKEKELLFSSTTLFSNKNQL